ncbi:MAG: hypothetical protein ACXWNK_13100 [Vulcanimicrobiaceae bacterium]
MLKKPSAISVGQLDPLAVARAAESCIHTMDARRIVATLVNARYRLSAFYRAEIVRLLRDDDEAMHGSALSAQAFADILRDSNDADILGDALIRFLRAGNLRVVDVIGGGFAAAIIRTAENDLREDDDSVLAVEQEGEEAPRGSWGRAFALVAFCTAIVLAGGALAAGIHYAGMLQTIRSSQRPAVKAVVSTAKRSAPFLRYVKFSARNAPFRQVILSAHPERRRL